MARKKSGTVQVTTYLSVSTHRAFKRMVGDLGTTMDKYLASYILQKVMEKGYHLPREPVQQYRTAADLVQETFDFLMEHSKLSTESLERMAAGHEPSEVDFLKLAIALKMEQKEMDDLFERSFPKSSKYKESKWT